MNQAESLEYIVEENRFTIAVVFPVIGAILLLLSANGILPDLLSFNPWLLLFGVFVMRLPLLAGIAPIWSKQSTLAILILSLYSYGVEYIGIITGYPYGSFTYGVDLGPTVGGIPFALPLLFIPLVLNAYLLVFLLLPVARRKRVVRIATTVLLVLTTDFVLDPGAVSLGFWSYAAPGLHGVPVSNYLGWTLSSLVAAISLDYAFDSDKLYDCLDKTPFMLDDMVSFVILWGGINAYYYNWAAVIAAIILGLLLIRADRFNTPW
jgi:carotene biosynthesis associated membrane protein